MNKYRIKRTDPNTGVIMEVGKYGDERQISEPAPYSTCRAFLLQHQEEMHVYKVGRIGSRKGAKRKFYRRIIAPGFVEAVEIFKQLAADETDTLQLCSGDWKLLAEKTPNGEIKYYLT